MAVEKVSYGGWENCYRLSNCIAELIATADVGPRIIRFGFVGDENEFGELPDQLGKVGGNEWRNYGGHRLWHAPEDPVRTYYPDNDSVEVKADDWTLELTAPMEKGTGVQKRICVNLDPNKPHVVVVHTLINHNLWTIELATWALTVMAKGGRAILPQPSFIPHPEKVLPARPIVQWHYTDMTDPRWYWGKRFIVLRQDPNSPSPQKIGIANLDGWGAYVRGDRVFLKRYRHIEGKTYPDFGSSTEVFTNAEILELETLGPMTKLEPGGSVEHVEHWFLYRGIAIGEDEESIASALEPILRETAWVKE